MYLKELNEAVNLAELACSKSNRQKVPPLLALAEALGALGKQEEALKVIEEGFALDPKNEELRSERARINLQVFTFYHR